MENVHSQSGEAPAAEAARSCPACSKPRPASAFYDGCSECKDCKRARSRRNRMLQARKLAAFERFVDVLVTLADRTTEPEVKEMAS